MMGRAVRASCVRDFAVGETRLLGHRGHDESCPYKGPNISHKGPNIPTRDRKFARETGHVARGTEHPALRTEARRELFALVG